MAKFRKKPVVIDAWKYEGLTGDGYELINPPEWLTEDRYYQSYKSIENIYIKTLEGDLLARPGWWIIRGVKGEIYPCEPVIFEETYEPVNE